MAEVDNAPIYRPLYEQIRIFMTQSLVAGEWKPGDMIPSEVELAARFNVSQGTVRKAIDALANENILVRRQGKGTYVATHKEEKSKLRFLRLTSAEGQKELLESRLIYCQRRRADAAITAQTGMNTGTAIIEIKRLLYFSKQPVILDEVVVPAKYFRGLNANRVNEHKGSLYSMYETLYGIPMVRASEKLTAVMASGEQAKQLEIKAGYPLLKIARVAYTYADKAIEWRTGYCVTDDHHYMNELE